MKFTNDDLKQLKEDIETCDEMGYSGFMNISLNRIDSLLGRLEAVEKAYYEYRNDTEVRHTPRQVELGKVWRKICGL